MGRNGSDLTRVVDRVDPRGPYLGVSVVLVTEVGFAPPLGGAAKGAMA